MGRPPAYTCAFTKAQEQGQGQGKANTTKTPGKGKGAPSKPELHLSKLEVAGEGLLKQSRQMLLDLEEMTMKKPYLKGLV